MDTMALQQIKEARLELALDSGIQKHLVVEQIVHFCGFAVVGRIGAGVGHFHIDDGAKFSAGLTITAFLEQLHHTVSRQCLVIIPVHPLLAVLLKGPALRVQINAGLHHHRLVKGEPVSHFAAKPLESSLGIADEQINDVFGAPAAIFGKQLTGQLVVLQTDHRLHTCCTAGIDHLFKVSSIFLVHHHVFVVGQEPCPVQRGAVALQTDLLHQIHIFLIAVVEVGCHSRTVAVVPCTFMVFVPQIHVGILRILFAVPAFRLPCAGSRTQKEALRQSNVSEHNFSFRSIYKNKSAALQPGPSHMDGPDAGSTFR